jgi:aminoglycoside/choline kinase family phosphotransferase
MANTETVLKDSHRLIRELDRLEDGAYKIKKLAGDASLRKYYRVYAGKDAYVLMLAEPFEAEKSDFLLVRSHLERCGVPVPALLAQDGAKGAILLEDLGDQTMLHVLGEDQTREEELFRQSLELLAKFHSSTKAAPDAIPVPGYALAFDEEKLMWEVDFTLEHLFGGYLKRSIPEEKHKRIRDSFVDICKRLSAEPRVFTHRDYHSRNIMITNSSRMVCIDFQDARMGLRAYDLASILRDSYFQLSEERVYSLLDHYLNLVKRNEGVALDRAHFIKMFDLMSIQRNFKAIGSFTSFYAKRNDAMYIRFVGNTFENIRRNLRKFPEYTELGDLLFHYYYF